MLRKDPDAAYPNAGIYMIRNKINGKMYIGSSQDVFSRTHTHFVLLKGDRHHNPRLQKAWNKYGEEAFEVVILEWVRDVHNLIEREQYWLDVHPAKKKYNVNVNATGWTVGKKMTDAQRERLSEVTYFRRVPPEIRKKGADKHRGKRWPEESRARHPQHQSETSGWKDKKMLNGCLVPTQEWKDHYGFSCNCTQVCRPCHRSIKEHGRLEFRGRPITSWIDRKKTKRTSQRGVTQHLIG